MRQWITVSLIVAAPFVAAGALLAGRMGIAGGLLAALVAQALAWLISRPILLWVCDAQSVDRATYPELVDTVSGLAATAGIPAPLVALSALRTPNAFAAATPGGGIVGVTVGLLELLSDGELEAVLAHEVAHLTRRGRALATVSAVFAALPGEIATVNDSDLFYDRAFTRSHVRRWGGRHLRPVRDGMATAATLLAALVVRFSTSSTAEFDADRGAIRLSGESAELVSALRKIDALAGRVASPVNPAMSHLLVIHPFSAPGLSRLFDIHPPLPERLNAIADFADDSHRSCNAAADC